MEFAIWAYPWDLVDEGVESIANRLVEMGITEVNLATNYHTVQTFSPRNPERKTFFARASAYFQPGDDYGRLRPVPNPVMGENDWVEQVADGFEGTPLSLNSWTVGCHNSRLGMNNRGATLQTPFGDPLVFGLCPSNPDVREYLLSLVADLDGRGSFDAIELETFHYFHGTGWGWHHDKFHTELGSLGEFLWGLCFCDHCRENAADAGVDTETADEAARAAILDLAEGNLPADTNVGEWLDSHPTVRAYGETRKETLASLYEELQRGVTADLGSYVGMMGVENSWMHGLDLEAHGEHLDYYTVMAYEPSVEEAVDDYTATVERSPNAGVDAGLLPGHPIVTDGETVASQVDELVEAGVDRISFYNYGLLPERNLAWIADAIAGHA